MPMKKKRILAVLLCFLFIQLTGCSFSMLDSQTLIAPPKANADQQEIHKLLQGNKSEITFIYPKNGNYRSAVIMNDFTGNGEEDALGFYLLETGGVEVKFLTKDDGVWKTIAAFKNAATQVDRVYFGDVNGDGTDDIIIGWGSTLNTMSASLCVYTYHDDFQIRQYQIEQVYGDMVLTDFDRDGVSEICLMQWPVLAQDETTEGDPAFAEVISLKGDEVRSLYKTEADSSIVRFASLQFCKITEDTYGVVADGAKANSSMNTQIFYMDDAGGFVGYPKKPNDPNTVNVFYRPAGASYTARDIDLDGVTEVPVAIQLPALGAAASPDSTSFLVKWVQPQLDSQEELKIMKITMMNVGENYWFQVPDWMEGKLTATNDSKLRAVTYTEVVTGEGEESEPLMGSPMFTVRVFSYSAWEQRGEPAGYEKLTEQNGYVYGILVYDNHANYSYSIDKIKQSFTIMTD